jgi:chromosome segregation ATPase
MPDRDYLELKLKDMRDTMAEMQGLITLMIAEREKCQKAKSELTTVMLGRESVVKSLQDAKDKAISEIRQQRDTVLGDLPADLKQIDFLAKSCLTVVRDAIKSLQDAKDKAISEIRQQRDTVLGDLPADLKQINSLANACLTAEKEIRRIEDGLRSMVVDLTAFRKTIQDERLGNVIDGFIDVVFKSIERMFPQKRGGLKIGGIGDRIM